MLFALRDGIGRSKSISKQGDVGTVITYIVFVCLVAKHFVSMTRARLFGLDGVLIVVGCACMLGTVGVEGHPDEDLIVSLPGQPKVEFKQYAGYVDIDVKHGRSLFYYFVEAENVPDKKPLTLWLNGGW